MIRPWIVQAVRWSLLLSLCLMLMACAGGVPASPPTSGDGARQNTTPPLAEGARQSATPERTPTPSGLALTASAPATPAATALPAVTPARTPAAPVPTPLPVRVAGPPQKYSGSVFYTEDYHSTSTLGAKQTHSAEGILSLQLRLDPEQSDEDKIVYVDDGGNWRLSGKGEASGPDSCTRLLDTYTGDGHFIDWNPSIEGTGIVELTVYRDPAKSPPLLTFSLVGHIERSGQVQNPRGCEPFHAANWWPFPTSMAGAELPGTLGKDAQTGAQRITFELPKPKAEGAFADSATGFVVETR
jgi:hypothetical protein